MLENKKKHSAVLLSILFPTIAHQPYSLQEEELRRMSVHGDLYLKRPDILLIKESACFIRQLLGSL
jgi:hypothetical protein